MSNVVEFREAVGQLATDLDAQKAALEETRKLRRSHEQDLKLKQEVIGRAKSKLANVTNHREFSAAEREVESARRDISMIEEQIIQLLEGEDAASKAIEERQERLDKLEADAAEQIEVIEKEAAVFDERMGEIKLARERLVGEIDRSLLARYERISSAKKGSAMAAIDDDGNCTLCRMKVPPQTTNLLIRGETIHACNSCKRLLYWPGVLEDEPVETEQESAPLA